MFFFQTGKDPKTELDKAQFNRMQELLKRKRTTQRELDVIRECCLRASSELNKISSPANINSKKQVVISGHTESVELSVKYLKERGSRKCIKLNVSVASHCELMKEAASSFEEVIDKSTITNPKYNFLNNYDACFINEISDIKENFVLKAIKKLHNIFELD